MDSLRKAAKAVLEWNVAAASWVLGSAWNAIAPVVPTPHPLEVVQENMPILAYRIAYLEVRCDYESPPKSTYRLTSWIYREHVLKPVEDARCARSKERGHVTPPDPACRCGFYGVPYHALDVLDRFRSYGQRVRLQVEFSGRVIEHERGYRAERQRILQVDRPTCGACGRKPATHVARTRDRIVRLHCGSPNCTLFAHTDPVMNTPLHNVISEPLEVVEADLGVKIGDAVQ